MRLKALSLAIVLLATGFTGCIGTLDDEDGNVTPAGTDASPDADEDSSSDDGSDDSSDGENTGEAATNDSTASDDETASANETLEGDDQGDELEPVDNDPMAVAAHIDTGINPYHEVFRENSRIAQTHPSEYIDGYPEDAQALNLTLDADSYEGALEEDSEIWENVERGQLYWVPGTRIVGLISFEAGGTTGDNDETPLLDDHGHGTMTGSRTAGEGTSLAPNARLVSVEGLAAESVRWAADESWIDVQTNSWVNFVPAPVNGLQDDAASEVPQDACTVETPDPAPADETIHVCANDTTTDAFAHAADEMVTLAASGNGAAYTAGVAPTPTYTLSTAPPGVTLVGAHDNGYIAPWSGSPPHVVADGFRPPAAVHDSLTAVETNEYSCCTSASAPYAAGAAANLVSAARTLLDDTSVGVEDGVVAEGESQIALGPLEDGKLTLNETRQVLDKTTAEVPRATIHSGDVHPGAQPDGYRPNAPPEPGRNAYCPGCVTTPVQYSDLPSEVPTEAFIGYGAVTPSSAQDARQVLAGNQELPDRADADAFYENDQLIRELVYSPLSGSAGTP
jgi:hypothetical protein